jgi:hypothetical protein
MRTQQEFVPPFPATIGLGSNENPVVHWGRSYIVDQLYIAMCRIERPDPNSRYGEVKWYYREAAKYAGRISAGNFHGENAKYKPQFLLDLNDFKGTRVKAELEYIFKNEGLDSVDGIVQEAISRIFLARHELIYYKYIESDKIRWRFV